MKSQAVLPPGLVCAKYPRRAMSSALACAARVSRPFFLRRGTSEDSRKRLTSASMSSPEKFGPSAAANSITSPTTSPTFLSLFQSAGNYVGISAYTQHTIRPLPTSAARSGPVVRSSTQSRFRDKRQISRGHLARRPARKRRIYSRCF